MATAERAAVGAEKARLEGRGPVGQTAEAAKNAATGTDGLGVGSGVGAPGTARGDLIAGGPAVGSGAPGTLGTGVESRGFPGHHRRSSSAGSGLMERTEEELARLRNRTQITHEGEAYCPNPNLRDLVSVDCRSPLVRDLLRSIFGHDIIILHLLAILSKSA